MNNSLTTQLPPRAVPMVRAPQIARWLSWMLFVFMIVMPFVLTFLPWQQNINAPGRVIAYDPELRQQTLEAPQDGRIYKIYPKENDRVRKDDLLVSIQDPDPNLLSNETLVKTTIETRKVAAQSRVTSFEGQMAAQKLAQKNALAAADKRISMARQSLVSAEEALRGATESRKLADINFEMERTMRMDGLTSRLTFLQAETQLFVRAAEENSRKAAREAAKEAIDAAIEDRNRTRQDFEATIQATQASIQMAVSEVQAAERDLQHQNIRLARLNTLEVRAPRDGVVHRVLANAGSGGTFVKQGDVLIVFIPDIPKDSKRIVEVFVDGNDAPQLAELWRQRLEDSESARIKARVQFEGYPVIQIIGWPNLAVGTFGGLVMSVDPHDDGKGKFRVLIEPDPEDRPWPSDFAVRQGARVQSWLLLDRVSIGFELWRRFNAFPPVMAGAEEDMKEKPAKVRLPK